MKILMTSDLATVLATVFEQYLNHSSVNFMNVTEGALLGMSTRIAEETLASYLPESQLSKLTATQKNEFLLFITQAFFTMMRYPRKNPWIAGVRVVQSDLMGMWATNWLLGKDPVLFETGTVVPGVSGGSSDGRSAPL